MSRKTVKTKARGIWAQLVMPNGVMVWVILRPRQWANGAEYPNSWDIEASGDVDYEAIRAYYELAMVNETKKVANMRDHATERVKARKRARSRGYWPY